MMSLRASAKPVIAGLGSREIMARGAFGGFALVFGALMLLGAGSIVRPLFTPVAIVVAVALFTISRSQYVTFVIWLFFLTPFVRRVVDYQLGYQETSVIVLAPILAAAVSMYTLVKKLPLLYSIGFLPFLMILCGLLYAYFVGIINNGFPSATYDLLLWVAPLALGFGIATDWRSYPAHRQAVFQSFLLGAIVLGVYGVYQYFFLPPWDAYWMRNATSITSIGQPYPEMIRVFGTMNSHAGYATVMMASFTIILTTSSMLRLPAAICGVGGWALTIVRTSWLGWLVAAGFLAFKLRGGLRMKLVGSLGALALVALPIIGSGSVGERFMERMATFGDIEEDKSFAARSALYDKMVGEALTDVWGSGTGALGTSTKLKTKTGAVEFNIDSGLIVVPYALGWPGTILFVIGISGLMLRPPGILTRNNEADVQTATAICIALLAMMVSYNMLSSVPGMIFWTFMGLRLSGRVCEEKRLAG